MFYQYSVLHEGKSCACNITKLNKINFFTYLLFNHSYFICIYTIYMNKAAIIAVNKLDKAPPITAQ